MREGKRDDLPGVGRIGHHLLVPGHRGVEADLTHRVTRCAEAHAPQHGAIGQHEDSGCPFRLLPGGMLGVRRGGVGHDRGRSGTGVLAMVLRPGR